MQGMHAEACTCANVRALQSAFRLVGAGPGQSSCAPPWWWPGPAKKNRMRSVLARALGVLQFGMLLVWQASLRIARLHVQGGM